MTIESLIEKLEGLSGDTSGRELSRQLRRGDDPRLQRRRRAAGLSLLAIGSMGLISLYQLGLIRSLPDLPGGIFDSDEVDGAPQAYEKLGMPDAVLGLRSYATTLALVATGDKNRARDEPWIPIALAGKALFDAFQAGKLSVDQWRKHRAFCIWCLLAAGATLATLPLVLPEAFEALE